MRTSQAKPALPMLDETPASFFERDDVVALAKPWPEEGLEAGLWGTIVEFLDAHTAEVEFTDRDGEVLRLLPVPLERLELVWSEPRP